MSLCVDRDAGASADISRTSIAGIVIFWRSCDSEKSPVDKQSLRSKGVTAKLVASSLKIGINLTVTSLMASGNAWFNDLSHRQMCALMQIQQISAVLIVAEGGVVGREHRRSAVGRIEMCPGLCRDAGVVHGIGQ